MCKKGYWAIHYRNNTTKFTNLFTYPDYTNNDVVDVTKISHFDIYLNKDLPMS